MRCTAVKSRFERQSTEFGNTKFRPLQPVWCKSMEQLVGLSGLNVARVIVDGLGGTARSVHTNIETTVRESYVIHTRAVLDYVWTQPPILRPGRAHACRSTRVNACQPTVGGFCPSSLRSLELCSEAHIVEIMFKHVLLQDSTCWL